MATPKKPACSQHAQRASALLSKPPKSAKPSTKAPARQERTGRAPNMSTASRFILANRGCYGVKSDDVEEEISANTTGFAIREAADPASLYMRTAGGRSNTGSVTTKAELGLSVTDFFDYNMYDPAAGGVPQPVINYFWSIDQNLFDNGTSVPFDDRERTFCRVRKVEVYVLPVKGFEIGVTGVNDTNATGQFTVNCQTPGVATVSSQAAIALNTQVTNVLPQIDTFWKKVFACDLQKTFQSGVARPYFDTAVDNFAQCLFQMSIVDSATGMNYLADNSDPPDFSIRVKVVISVDQPIATIQNAKLRVFKNESFITPSLPQNGSPFAAPREQYVQMNLRKKLDFMR